MHLLGLNLLALQHVCSLSKQADRQRGQTGCYKTQPGERGKKTIQERRGLRGLHAAQVIHARKSTLCTFLYLCECRFVLCSLHILIFLCLSPVLQTFEVQIPRASKCDDISLCVCVCVPLSVCVLLTHWT